MDTSVITASITAFSVVAVAACTFYLTKSKEREAEWQRYKFELYKDFIQFLNGIVGGDATPEDQRRFSSASNTLHLIGSRGVLNALHAFQDEIRVSNLDKTLERHDLLLSRLEWEIREDLHITHNPPIEEFNARLWCSGTGTDMIRAPKS